jgi:hypothetical protein
MLEIIKKYELEYYLKVLITENSGNNNFYHNFQHTTTVMMNVYHISLHEDLSRKKIRLLLIAALFYDFNHSGGKLNDSENIKLAIDAFKKYSKESDKHNKFIIDIIKCTQYPYNVEEDENLTKCQKIIRDADCLHSIEDNFIQQILFGLNKECGNNLTITTLKNQIKFIEELKVFTYIGKSKYKSNLSKKINDCKYLIKILNGK